MLAIENAETYWVGHPDALAYQENITEDQKLLIARRADIILLGNIADTDLSYEYDELAVVKLDEVFYLLQTSGCSCPSPSDTWRVETKSESFKELWEYIEAGEYGGCTYKPELVAGLLKDVVKNMY